MVFNKILKKLTFSILFICIMLLINVIDSNAQFDSFNYDGKERTCLLHLPMNYDESTSYPIVIAMHGGTGNATNIQNQSKLSEKDT